MRKREQKTVVAAMLCAALALTGITGCSSESKTVETNQKTADGVVEKTETKEAIEIGLPGVQATSYGTEAAENAKNSQPSGYQLTQLGTISDPDHNVVVSAYDALYYQKGDAENERFTLLSAMGEPLSEENFVEVKAIAPGIYRVVTDSDTINGTGAIDEEGNVLIPFDAANVELLMNYNAYEASGRYLKVTYATGETEDLAEAVYYTTEKSLSTSPQEGEPLYTGYVQFYDLEKRQFVENVKLTNWWWLSSPSSSYQAVSCGDFIIVNNSDGAFSIYDDMGTVKLQLQNDEFSMVGNEIATITTGQEGRLYNTSGEMLYSSVDSLKLINGSGNFACEETYDENKKPVINILDRQGQILFSLDGNHTTVLKDNDNILCICHNDINYLTDLAGRILYQTEEKDVIPNAFGYWYHSTNQETEHTTVLIAPDGTTYKTTEPYDHNLIFYKKQENGSTYDFLVLNDSDFTLSLQAEEVNQLTTALVSVQWNRKNGLYDLISGKELLPMEYTDIQYAQGNIYAYKSGVWEMYKLELLR